MNELKRYKRELEEASPHWTMSYSDMVTLLLVFFVLMLAYSRMSQAKFTSAINSIRKSIALNKKDVKLIQEEGDPEKLLNDLKKGIEALEIPKEIRDQIKIFKIEEGVLIMIGNPAMFERGKADLRPQILPVLYEIAKIIKDRPFDISIEGHTCDLPIHSYEFKSNWELSSARALNVLHFFEECGVDPYRMQAVAHAYTRPIAPNDCEENRRKNRRVEIKLILKE